MVLFIFFTLHKSYIDIIICLALISYFHSLLALIFVLARDGMTLRTHDNYAPKKYIGCIQQIYINNCPDVP